MVGEGLREIAWDDTLELPLDLEIFSTGTDGREAQESFTFSMELAF